MYTNFFTLKLATEILEIHKQKHRGIKSKDAIKSLDTVGKLRLDN